MAVKSKKAPAKSTRKKSAAPAKKAKKKAAKKPAKKPIRKGPDTVVDEEVLEFIAALDAFKKEKNRPFPTWSEVLQVLKELGYRRA